MYYAPLVFFVYLPMLIVQMYCATIMNKLNMTLIISFSMSVLSLAFAAKSNYKVYKNGRAYFYSLKQKEAFLEEQISKETVLLQQQGMDPHQDQHLNTMFLKLQGTRRRRDQHFGFLTQRKT